THRAGVAEPAGDRPGVDAGDPDDPEALELLVERARRAVVRDDAGGVADGVAGDPDLRGLLVLAGDARVADVRRRHDDDLPRVARVGDRLLVAGHAGREDDLTEALADGAVGDALVAAAVLED